MGGFGDGGFDMPLDDFAATPMEVGVEDRCVAATVERTTTHSQHHSARRTSRLLTTALGRKGLELLELRAEDFEPQETPGGLANGDRRSHGAQWPQRRRPTRRRRPPTCAAPKSANLRRATRAPSCRRRPFAHSWRTRHQSCRTPRRRRAPSAPCITPAFVRLRHRVADLVRAELLSANERLMLAPLDGLCAELSALHTDRVRSALANEASDDNDAGERATCARLRAC